MNGAPRPVNPVHVHRSLRPYRTVRHGRSQDRYADAGRFHTAPGRAISDRLAFVRPELTEPAAAGYGFGIPLLPSLPRLCVKRRGH